MFDPFWIKIFLAFGLGGVWITGTTIIAERFGTKIGGWIGGLPSTVFLSLLFIGIVQSPATASEAANVTPFIISFGTVFLVSYMILSRFGHLSGLILSLVLWFALSGFIAILNPVNFPVAVITSLIISIGAYYLVEQKVKIISRGKIVISYTLPQIIWRALFGGVVISFATFMSKFEGSVFGGIFAAFPATFISTLMITHKSGGLEFSRAIAKTLMISGAISPIVYVLAVKYLYIGTSLAWGTILAYALAILSSSLLYLLIKKDIR